MTDQQGNPIAGASVVFPESGDETPLAVDDTGQVAWHNLPGTGGSLTISAQGYLPAQQSLNLERGANEVVVALHRDPYAIFPEEACAPGETLLYVEDFQDGEAQSMGGFQEGRPDILLGPAPDVEGDIVLIHDLSKASPDSEIESWLKEAQHYFDAAVWRLRFMVSDRALLGFGWRSWGPSEFNGMEVSGTVYQIRILPSPTNAIIVYRSIWDAEGRPLVSPDRSEIKRGTFRTTPGAWHYLEISTFQGHIQVWVDGKSEVDVQDSLPLPPGGLSIGPQVGASARTAVVYYDALTVCGLTAPFAPMSPPVPVPAAIP